MLKDLTKNPVRSFYNPKWKDLFEMQKAPGLCGSATIHLVLKYVGKNIPSDKIHQITNIPWIGVPNGVLLAFLSRFFTDIGQIYKATPEDILDHLTAGYIVVVNWWDTLPPLPADGHYCIVGGIDLEKNKITLVDTSKTGRAIWEYDLETFMSFWYDIKGKRRQPGTRIDRWMTWVHPNSLVEDSEGEL